MRNCSQIIFIFFCRTKPDTDSQFGRGSKVYLGAQQLCCSPGWLWHSSCHLPALCWAVGNYWTLEPLTWGSSAISWPFPFGEGCSELDKRRGGWWCPLAPVAGRGWGILLMEWHICPEVWEICLQRCYRFYGGLQTRGSSLLSLPRVTFHSLRQPRAKFILEVGHPVPETKECCSRAFIRFICFIKGPIVFSLKQDYPAGISCSAWVRKTGTLHFHSELLLPAEMHWNPGEQGLRIHRDAGVWKRGPRGAFTIVGLIWLDFLTCRKMAADCTSSTPYHANIPVLRIILAFNSLLGANLREWICSFSICRNKQAGKPFNLHKDLL